MSVRFISPAAKLIDLVSQQNLIYEGYLPRRPGRRTVQKTRGCGAARFVDSMVTSTSLFSLSARVYPTVLQSKRSKDSHQRALKRVRPSPRLVVGSRDVEVPTCSVRSFLRGRTFVLTGSTGFLAKVFLEKLLWEQDDVRKVFLIITPRRGCCAEMRLRNEIVNTPLFDRLRQKHGARFQSFIERRLVAVDGDLGVEGLGLSRDAESAIIDEAEVFVNSAATTSFNERFDTAVNTNTLGPRRLLRLSSKCPNLMLMCHVSTAFVNGFRRGPVEERAFTIGDRISGEFDPSKCGAGLDPYAEVALALSAGSDGPKVARESFFQSATGIEDDSIEDKCRIIVELAGKRHDFSRRHDSTHKHASSVSRVGSEKHEYLVRLGLERARMHGWQDSYVFTKAMGEQLLTAEREDVPLVIVRPSIIEGALHEPFPGWIEGVRMADPLILAYGKGLIRGFVGDQAGVLDLIPVDTVVNVMLAAMPGNAHSKRCTRRSEHLDSKTLRRFKRNCIGNNLRRQFHCKFSPEFYRSGDDVTVYHVATSTLNPLKLSEFMEIIARHFTSTPLTDRRSGKVIVADECIKVFTSRLAFECDTWFRQGGVRFSSTWIREKLKPDSVSPAMKRRNAFARRTLEQLRSMGKIYMPYTTYKARFRSENIENLRSSVCDFEQEKFPLELETLDWEEYLRTAHIPGLLQHALKKL